MKMRKNFTFLVMAVLVFSILATSTISASVKIEYAPCKDIENRFWDCVLFGSVTGGQGEGSNGPVTVCGSGVACSSTSSNCGSICRGLSSTQQRNFKSAVREVGDISETLSSEQMGVLATAQDLRIEDSPEGKTLIGTRCASGPSIGECRETEEFSFDVSGSHLSDGEVKEILRQTGNERAIESSSKKVVLPDSDLEVSCGSSQFSIEKTGSDDENREPTDSENSRDGFLSGLFTAN